MLDFDVVLRNLPFLMVQGFLGFGNFVGGTVRLAIPAIGLSAPITKTMPLWRFGLAAVIAK